MSEFPKPPPSVIEMVETHLRAIHDAEHRLKEVVATDPQILDWLRESRLMRRDVDEQINQAQVFWAEALENDVREVLYRDADTFINGYREMFKRAGRKVVDELYGAGTTDHSEPDAGEPKKSLGDTELLRHAKMREVEQLFREPVKKSRLCKSNQEYFVLICQILFRIKMWRYVFRTQRSAKKDRRRAMMSDAKLAYLLKGFGQTAEEARDNGRTISNWLKPSREQFDQFLINELIDDIMQEAEDPEPAGPERDFPDGDERDESWT